MVSTSEWKIFESPTKELSSLNVFIEDLAKKGWEVVSVDMKTFQIFAKRGKVLLD